jgi:hypothetical protein
VRVDTAGRAHRLELERCDGRVSTLTLFDTDGETELARASDDGTGCAVLEHTFENAGRYPLELSTPAAAQGPFELFIDAATL